MAGYKITLNKNGGTGGTSAFYTDGKYATSHTANSFYSDSGLTKRIEWITTPTRSMFSFTGYYSTSSGGDKLIDSGGNLYLLDYKQISTNATAYAGWKRLSWDFNLNAEGSSIPKQTVYIKVSVGGPYSDDNCQTPATSVPVPTMAGFRFLGYFGNSGTKYVNADGTFTSALLERVSTKAANVYAEWEAVHTLTFDANGGDVEPASKTVVEGVAIGELPTPTLESYHFDGWYTEGIGGTLVTDTTVYTWTDDITIYAHWTKFPVLTFDPNGGTVSPTTRECWYGEPIGTLPRPTLPGYFFEGWYTEIEGGDRVDAETTYDWQGDTTIFAHWTVDERYKITFDANGGTASERERFVSPGEVVGELPEATYEKHAFGGWWTAQTGGTQWTDDTVFDRHEDITLFAHWTRTEFTLTFAAQGGTASFTTKEVTRNAEVGELPTCEKYANTFLGWFDAATGGTQWTDETVFDRTEDTKLYAQWLVDPSFQRTLVLDANGGTVSPGSVVCTYGLSIGTIPRPERTGKIFSGWWTARTGGTRYEESTVCSWSGSRTAYARWIDDAFGNLTDWFGLETNNGPLMLVGSSDGATRSVVETSHSGALAIQTEDSTVGAFERGGILRNPVCTYRIRKQGFVNINLGTAWAMSGSAVSGYMLISAEYATEANGEPVLVVRGAANEGAAAINQWTVRLDVNPDHIAQDPMGAVSGGGELTECRTIITCDPVVPMENGMPCASDVVHGKIVVTATTNAYLGESAPTARGSFLETNGVPNGETDVDFTTYAFQAERSL